MRAGLAWRIKSHSITHLLVRIALIAAHGRCMYSIRSVGVYPRRSSLYLWQVQAVLGKVEQKSTSVVAGNPYDGQIR